MGEGAGGSESIAGNGGSVGSGTGGSATQDSGDYLFPEGRGPQVTFTTYEAESMMTDGVILGPSRDFGQVAAECSQRMCVRLDAEGEYVSFVNDRPSNSIVVRYSIPNGGLDYWTTLTVLVDGIERTKLDVTSRYSWSYRNESDDIFNTPDQKNPGAGQAHHFFDETRAIVGDIPVGSTVSVKKSSGDGAAHYDIDLIEMEQVADPLPQPPGFKSIETCGATNNGDLDDDTAAIQACLDNPGPAGVYIPAGVYYVKSDTLENDETVVRGAGMWHSTIMGYRARFACWNGDCEYYDFSIFGDTTQRGDADPDAAFDGNDNNNVVLENIWVEHRRVGYWTSNNTHNLVIRNSRFRNLHADAVNLYGGASNSVVEHCHIRNTGDDGLAAWSHDRPDRNPNEGNVFRHNYVQLVWKANCFGIYGGNNTSILDNVCTDTLQYSGILLGRLFDAHGFSGLTHIERNTLLRAGGRAYGSNQGAIRIYAQQGPLDNVRVKDLDIIAPTYSAIHIQGPNFVGNTIFDGVLIEDPGTSAFYLSGSSRGAMDAIDIMYQGDAPGVESGWGAEFAVNKVGDGNSGW